MSKIPFNLDERYVNTVCKICAVLYMITVYSLIGILSYRQFVLHQETREFNDIAILTTFNIIVFLGSLLFISGGVNPRKMKRRWIIAGYGGFVLIGFIFTVFKYTVLLGQKLSLAQVVDYFLTVAWISGALALVLGLLAYLGNKRIEKQIGNLSEEN